MPSVSTVLSHIFLSVGISFNSLSLPQAGSELPSEDITRAGPEHSPAVFEAPAELSCIVVAVIVEGGPLPALQKGLMRFG